MIQNIVHNLNSLLLRKVGLISPTTIRVCPPASLKFKIFLTMSVDCSFCNEYLLHQKTSFYLSRPTIRKMNFAHFENFYMATQFLGPSLDNINSCRIRANNTLDINQTHLSYFNIVFTMFIFFNLSREKKVSMKNIVCSRLLMFAHMTSKLLFREL